MPSKTQTSKSIALFNKHGLQLYWPRLWIIILGIVLLFLCLSIAGMEVGHTLFELRRSNAFGGFIVFIPLLILIVFVFITAFKTTLVLLRVTVVLSFVMIFLLMVLIAYDILVLIDPTRCFFFDCNYAPVYVWNSTTNSSVVGWPLYISWPTYFQNNMNAVRIFQGIQLLCAGLFILFTALYLLTYFIYRHIRLDQEAFYHVDRPVSTANETRRASPVRVTNHFVSPMSLETHHSQKVTTYVIEAHAAPATQHTYAPAPVTQRPYAPVHVTQRPYAPAPVITKAVAPITRVGTPKKVKPKPTQRPRAQSLSYDRLCTRCDREPRLMLRTPFERENFFGHLCVNCNNELLQTRRKPTGSNNKTGQSWVP